MSQQWHPQQPHQGFGQPYPPPGHTPLGQQPLPSDDITRYAPPRQNGPIIAAVLGVVALLVVVAAGLLLPRTPAAPVAAPTPSASTPGGVADRPGQPFIMPNNASATGRWQVVDHEWTDEGVLVQVRVACDTQTCSYGFTAFPNDGRNSVDPVTSPRQPQLSRGSLQAGQSTTGYVFLPMPRGAATLILTTSAGRAISALPIAA